MNENSIPSVSPQTARAEEVVDVAGRMLSTWVSRIWNEAARSAALAREEAEDVVAEARSMSQSQQG